jgi:AcrR family transcriptional regulator
VQQPTSIAMNRRPEPNPDSPWPKQEERERDRIVKRDAVLDTAVRMFNEKGFRATSIDQVAIALNVTKPTIYHYFSNKDEILFECVRKGLQVTLDAAQKVEKQGGNGLERLKSLIHDYAVIATEPFGKCVTRTADHDLSEASRKKFRGLKRETDSVIRKVVVSGMQDGSITPGDPRLVTFCVSGALNWISRWYEQDGSLSPEEIAETYVEILINGLAPRR